MTEVFERRDELAAFLENAIGADARFTTPGNTDGYEFQDLAEGLITEGWVLAEKPNPVQLTSPYGHGTVRGA